VSRYDAAEADYGQFFAKLALHSGNFADGFLPIPEFIRCSEAGFQTFEGGSRFCFILIDVLDIDFFCYMERIEN
jgi:hypothetical protein